MLAYGGKMVSKVPLASYGMEMFPPLYFEFETSSRSFIRIETVLTVKAGSKRVKVPLLGFYEL